VTFDVVWLLTLIFELLVFKPVVVFTPRVRLLVTLLTVKLELLELVFKLELVDVIFV